MSLCSNFCFMHRNTMKFLTVGTNMYPPNALGTYNKLQVSPTYNISIVLSFSSQPRGGRCSLSQLVLGSNTLSPTEVEALLVVILPDDRLCHSFYPFLLALLLVSHLVAVHHTSLVCHLRTIHNFFLFTCANHPLHNKQNTSRNLTNVLQLTLTGTPLNSLMRLLLSLVHSLMLCSNIQFYFRS